MLVERKFRFSKFMLISLGLVAFGLFIEPRIFLELNNPSGYLAISDSRIQEGESFRVTAKCFNSTSRRLEIVSLKSGAYELSRNIVLLEPDVEQTFDYFMGEGQINKRLTLTCAHADKKPFIRIKFINLD